MSSGTIEVYLAKGKGALEGTVDFARLKELAATLPDVGTVHDGSDKEEHGTLTARIESGETTRVVLAGYTDDVHVKAFTRLFADKGGGETLFAAADFRNMTRGLDGADANALAEAALRQAVARVGATEAAEVVDQGSPDGVLVLGEGPAAMSAAASIAASGLKVTLATEDGSLGRTTMNTAFTAEEAATAAALGESVVSAGVEVLTSTFLVKVDTEGNGFRARLAQEGETPSWRSFGAVVAAPEPTLAPRTKLYGLEPGPAVATMSNCEAVLADEAQLAKVVPAGEARTLVFLVGVGKEAQVVASARALRAAAKIAAMKGPVVRIITGNLKVAGAGLEALATEARDKGAVIFKVNPPETVAPKTEGGKIVFSCRSEILNEDLQVAADMVIVDEDVEPSAVLRTLEDGLHLEMGPEGLLQPDNVHMTPLGTSHEGLFAAGPARGVFDLEGSIVDGGAVAGDVAALLTPGSTQRVKTTVDEGLCVACLTCYRLCPHGAISFDDFPRFSPLFCQGCGICSGACPQNAITVTAYPDDRVTAEIQAAADAPRAAEGPAVLALLCRRSAVEALKLARHLGEELPTGLRVVELPCAGRVDEEHVLAGLVAGFDGVMVLGCHDDNCRSIRGNMHARNRVEWLKPKLDAIGMEPERLWFGTVASNMSAELAEQCRSFAALLAEMGAPGEKKKADAEAAQAAAQA